MNGAANINIAAHLPEMARRQPDTPAILFPRNGRSLTFRELNGLSDRVAHGLVACGIGRGMRTCLMVTPGIEFFAITFALLLNEIRSTFFKRTIQTLTYLPHFLSWVVLAGILIHIGIWTGNFRYPESANFMHVVEPAEIGRAHV